MVMEITPPGLTSKSFENYKQELLAWREVTGLSKSKQGIVVALSLPEDDANLIREQVFDQLSLEDLKKEDGLDILIKFLDTHLGKDELIDSIDKYEDFENFERVDRQSIEEFIALFDAKYKKIEKLNIKLPSEVLAFKLLRKANISKEDRMLVLTGINFSTKEQMYKQAKQSLSKFLRDRTDRKVIAGSEVKLEPKGLVEQMRKAGNIKQCHGDTCKLEKSNKDSKTKPDCKRSGNGQMRKKKNHVGIDGRILLCASCGSYRHLVAECPDSWENMERSNHRKKGHVSVPDSNEREETNERSSELQLKAFNVELNAALESIKKEVASLKGEIKMIKSDKDKQFQNQTGKPKCSGQTIQQDKGEHSDILYQLKDVLQDSNLALSEDKSSIEKQTRTRISLEETVEELQQIISRLEKDRGVPKDKILPSDVHIKSWELLFDHEASLLESQKHEEHKEQREIIENQLFKYRLGQDDNQLEPLNQKKAGRLRNIYTHNELENQIKALNAKLEDKDNSIKITGTLLKTVLRDKLFERQCSGFKQTNHEMSKRKETENNQQDSNSKMWRKLTLETVNIARDFLKMHNINCIRESSVESQQVTHLMTQVALLYQVLTLLQSESLKVVVD